MEKHDFGNVYSVYVLTFPNGKKYVGLTRQKPSERWRGGKGYKNQNRVYNEIQKAGWENIKHEIIKEKISVEDASNLEKELIKKYNTRNPEFGFNYKSGGQTSEHTEEFKEKVSERMRGNKYCVGRKISESHKEKLRKSNIGTHRPCKNKGKCFLSAESKALISQKAKERWKRKEYREKMQAINERNKQGQKNPMYGKHHSEETKIKLSELRKGSKHSIETINKLKESHKKQCKAVCKCDFQGKILERFESVKDASDSVNGNITNISFACTHPI